MHIFCKAIAETAGIDYIIPPKTAKLLRMPPKFFLEYWTKIIQVKEGAFKERYIDSLRKAGLK